MLSVLYPTTDMEKLSYASSCAHPPPLQYSLPPCAQLPCVQLHMRVWTVQVVVYPTPQLTQAGFYSGFGNHTKSHLSSSVLAHKSCAQ